MMIHADEDLRILLLLTCSQYMSLPLLSYNCWEYNDDGTLKLLIWNEIFFIYEKSKSLLTLKISKEKQNCPQRQTEFINQLFGKDFSIHSDSQVNNQTIEIQFDHNCDKTNYISIADAHGIMSIQIFKKVWHLFDAFIIHSNNESYEQLDEIIQFINNQNQNQQIIVIIHDKNQLDMNFQFQQNNKLFEYKVMQFQKQFDIYFQKFLKQVQKQLLQFYDYDSKEYKSNPQLRIKSKILIIQFLKNFDQSNLQIYYDFIEKNEILIQLIQKQQDFTSYDFLPMLTLINKKCNIENQLKIDSDMTQDQRDILNIQTKQIQKNIEQLMPTKLVQLYILLISTQNCIKVLPFLSSLIKEYLDSIQIPLIQERSILNSKYDYESNQEQKQDIQKQIQEINNLIQINKFSHEFISREIYYDSLYSKAKHQSLIAIKDYYQQQFQTGQPFEIVDGESLQFIHQLQNFHDEQEDLQTLIVSVVGPQSSGKSFIMNYLFGTFFLSSSGRCTKGIYGSVLNYICKETNKKYRILVLDTEGIQSSEARDSKFDQRIIFYILSISHVILICNKGEMNKQMSEVVKLAADAIQNTQQNLVINPTVFIILNQMNKTDDSARLACINQLQNELQEINQQDSINKILRIVPENIFPLGFAFGKNNYGPNNEEITVFKSDSLYSNQILKLREKILEKFIELENKKSSFFTTKEWYQFAFQFWEFTDSFSAIIDYTSLQQKREDQILIVKIQELVDKYLDQDQKQQTYDLIQNELDQIFEEKERIGTCAQFDMIYSTIKQNIELKYQDLSNILIEEYQKFCQQNDINKDLKEKRKSVIIIRKKSYEQDCINYFNIQISEFIDQKSQSIGLSKIHQRLRELVSSDQKFDIQQAQNYFEEIWQIIINDVKKILKNENMIYEEISQQITNDFALVSIDARKVDSNENYIWINKLKETINNQDLFLEFLNQKMQDKLLFYIGDQINPDFNKIKQFQELRQKNYLNLKGIDKILINNKIVFKFYDYKRALNSYKDMEWFFKKNIIQMIVIQIGYPPYQQYKINQLNNIQIQFLQVQKIFNNEIQNIGLIFKTDINCILQKINMNQIYNQIELQKLIEQIKQNIDLIFNDSNNFQFLNNDLINVNISQFNFNDFIVESQYKKKDGLLLINEVNKNLIEDNFNNYLQKNKQNLRQYLNFILNYGQQKQQKYNTNEASKELFDFIDLKKVCNDIQKEIIKIYRKDTQYNQINVLDYIKQLQSKSAEEKDILSQQFSKINQQQIKAIVDGIKDIVKNINDELSYFSMQISTQGLQLIFLLSQTYVNLLATNLEIVCAAQPLIKLQQRKKQEQESFIAKLTQNDIGMDISLAQKIVQDLIQLFHKQAKDFASNEFKNQINQIKDQFLKLNIFNDLENQMLLLADKKLNNINYQLNENDNQLIKKACQFYRRPKQFLENIFNQKFDQQANDFKIISLQTFNQIFLTNLKSVLNFFTDFKELLQKRNLNANSAEIFQLKDQNVNKQNQKFLKQSAVIYLSNFLKQNWKNTQEILIENLKIRVHPEYKDKLPQTFEFIKNEDQIFDKIFKIKKIIFDKDDQINNIFHFISQIIKGFDQKVQQLELFLKEKNYQSEISEQDLIGDFKILLQLQFMGCNEYCPLCHRQCDKQHKNELDIEQIKHECISGHQIQAFGGSYQDDYKALTISCNELQDSVICKFEDKDIKWVVLKEKPKLKNWIFSAEKNDLAIFKEKSIKIWNLIGPSLCQLYNNEGNPIQYQQAQVQNQFKSLNTHFILLLDSSFSMREKDDKWTDLMKCIKTFLSQLEKDVQIRQKSKVSIIRYDDTCEVVHEKQPPSVNLADNIKFNNGGTNFKLPLQYAFDICKKTHKEFDQIIIYFMTDGQVEEKDYPSEIVQQFSLFEIEKILFYAVGFGNDDKEFNIIKRISSQFKYGQMTVAKNLNDLQQSIRKIVSIITDQ